MSGPGWTIKRMREKEDAVLPHLSRPSQPTAPTNAKACGHARHVGHCGCCQRAQLERWSAQLANARPARRQTH